MLSRPFILAAFLALAGIGPAAAEVLLTREGDVVTRAEIRGTAGSLVLFRNLWSCARLRTAAQVAGRKPGEIDVTDPLMYNCQVRVDGKQTGGYWNAPEVWNRWKIAVIRQAPPADILSLTADIPEWGLRKEVTISVPAGESRAYVYSRLTATRDVELLADRQCCYPAPTGRYRFTVDGAPVEPADGRRTAFRRWAMAYAPQADAGFAVLAIDRKAQLYPGSEDANAAFGTLAFYKNEKADGADLSWDKGSGFLAKGDVRIQQYLLLWGDGDLREEAAQLSRQALSGALNTRVHSLGGPPAKPTDPAPAAGLSVSPVECGVWLPVRTQPTTSPDIHQHSTYLSPANAARARQVLASLKERKPMLLVRGEFGRVLVGEADGLIHGMRPAVLAASFQGSYLREYSPEALPPGRLSVVEETAGRVRLLWRGGSSERELTVTPAGVVRSRWKNPPRRLWLITGGHPYHYLATARDSTVRFSQLLQRRRRLGGESRLAFHGYRDASLEVSMAGLRAESEEIWLDSGEVGWEWAMEYRKEHPGAPVDRPFFSFMERHGALTYLAGGAIRVVSLGGSGAAARLDYRIGTRGPAAVSLFAAGDPFAAAERAFPAPSKAPAVAASPAKGQTVGLLPAKAPAAGALPAEVPAGAQVRVTSPDMWTLRLWPNHFNGWELRPVTMAHHNPLPAFYEITLTNPEGQPRQFLLSLARAGWMAGAWIESEREEWTSPVGTVPIWKRTQAFWRSKSGPVVVVPARGKETVLLKVQPKEETLGRYRLALGWSAGRSQGTLPLSLLVKPNILVDPYGDAGMAPEDFRYFGQVTWGFHPLYFDWHYDNVPAEEQDRYLTALRAQAQRNGSWVRDIGFLREYITTYTQKSSTGSAKQTTCFQQPPDDFVRTLREKVIQRKAAWEHRARVYMMDEIWEILGGYKGRRYMPVEEVARWMRDIVMDSPTPCWGSFMQPGIDDQYQCKLPNDVAELFYYCGRDEGFQAYVEKLVKPRTALFEQWRKEPEARKRAGAAQPRQVASFWISGQLHVTDYPAMRRQHWYSRFHGIDSILMWRMHAGDMVYADRIGCNAVMAAGNKGAVLMTDRGLAWYDLWEDMSRLTLLRMLLEKAPPAKRSAAAALEQAAYRASQKNDFDAARHQVARAIRLLDAALADTFAAEPAYRPVPSEPLPDLFAEDRKQRESARRTAVLPKLKGGHRPPPTLDGVLDNCYLEEGATLDGFVLLNKEQPASEQTTVYLARDETNLYLLFQCKESQMGKLVAVPNRPRDEATYEDDCVEVFLDRVRDGAALDQFIAGAGGGRYDGRVRKRAGGNVAQVTEQVREWDPEWRSVVRKDATGWTAEMVLPFAAIGGPPAPGETWGINFCREQKPKGELSTWSPMSGGFRAPAQFGEMRLP